MVLQRLPRKAILILFEFLQFETVVRSKLVQCRGADNFLQWKTWLEAWQRIVT